MKKKSAIVVGAGIVGLATARALALRDYSVKVFEQLPKATGASVRNFGMIWPIGQPKGKMYEAAMRSRAIWEETCAAASIWHDKVGSLHLAHAQDEWQVLEEFYEAEKGNRSIRLLKADQVSEFSGVANTDKLIGGLYSADEMIVEARDAIGQVARYLEEQHSVQFFWNKKITAVSSNKACSGKEKFSADEIFICSGQDFESLYPDVFAASGITRCKLQMMRLAAQPLRIGAALCGGLSLTHYASFAVAKSLQALKKRIENTMPDYVKWGIHVMISQNAGGEITLGDTHEYGLAPDPFGRDEADQLILDYLKTFARLPSEQVIQHWTGVYPKLMNGEWKLVARPEEGVTVINGVGGAGMTLSFGLAERVVQKL
ncbi:MAG: TIGR03364 family FAD-dependent oxidoreductase [Mucilaginibacter polytrichastri]|nr:TIGR03364 family FAD-dependent oxidoreductase [Mucilaginibacter polytrichastri]